jgi:hypothetical protein
MKHIRIVALFATLAMATAVFAAETSAAGTVPTFHPVATAFTGTGQVLQTEKLGGVIHRWESSFTFNSGNGPYFKCENISLSGVTKSVLSSEVSVKPTINNCIANWGGGLVAVEVETPQEWTVTATERIGTGSPAKYKVAIGIRGPVKLKLAAIGCELTWGEQTVYAEGVNDVGSPAAGTTIDPTTAAPLEINYTGNSGCTSNGINNGVGKFRGAVHIPTVFVE